jgi:hypothetical protein
VALRNAGEADVWGDERNRHRNLQALAVGAVSPLLALAITAVWLSSLKEIDDGLEALVIVPILFVLGIAVPFLVAPSLETLVCIVAGATVSGAVASLALGIGPVAGAMFAMFFFGPGVVIGSAVHDLAAVALVRARSRHSR